MLLNSFIISSWQSSFPNIGLNNIMECRSDRLSNLRNNIYVLDCNFLDLSVSDHGAAISCTAGYFLAEFSSFINCKAQSNFGGALFVSTYNYSGLAVSKCCSFNCACVFVNDSWGQFCRLSTGITGSHIFFDDCSVLRTDIVINETHDTIGIYQGDSSLRRNNISNNLVYDSPTFGYYNPLMGFIQYTTMINNSAYKNNLMVLKQEVEFKIDSCNFLINKVPDFFYLWGYLTVQHSYFASNEFTNLVHMEKDNNATFIDCCMDFEYHNSESIFVESTPKNSFVNALLHFSTENCQVTEEQPIPVTLIKTHYCTNVPMNHRKRIGYDILNFM